MPHFHIHQYRHAEAVLDSEGAEYSSLQDAIGEAAQAAREIIAERIRTGEALDASEFRITDQANQVRATVAFTDVAAGKSFPPPPLRRP